MERSAKTAGPYVTSVLNTCSPRVGVALPDFRGQCSGSPVACFRLVFPVLHLLHSVTQRSIFLLVWFQHVCLWSLEAKPQTPRYLFYVFQTEPPTQSQHTTGRSIHICCSDLEHHHFIVWHTICIKLQFSVLKGLAWLKTGSDGPKRAFHTH